MDDFISKLGNFRNVSVLFYDWKTVYFLKCCLFFVIFSTSADALQLGHCPYVRPQTDLKVSDFLGNWYEYAKYSIPTEALSDCISLEFKQSPNEKLSYVRTLTGKLTGIQVGYTGIVKFVRPGVLQLSADGIAGIFGNSTISILGTDYSSYAVGFACEEFLGLGIFHRQHAFVLTRERQPDQEAINSAEDALRNNGLSVQNLILTNQHNCTLGR